MKKISVFIIISVLISLAIFGYLYFTPKFKNFLNSESFLASTINTYISYKKGEDDGFTFAVLSDSEREDTNLSPTFQGMIKNANKSGAEFLIHMGDFTHQGKETEYQEVKNYLDQNLKIPYYLAPGNHDILQDKDDKKTFQKYFGKLYYSFDFKNAHFIILDNSNNKVGFNDDQISWLKDDLEENKNKQIFIFMHRPINVPYVEKIDVSDGATKKAKESYNKFIDLIKNYEISKIFAGHVHIYFTYTLEGVPVLITGGGGSEPNLPFWDTASSFEHYILVKVRKNSDTAKVIELKK
jgi:3',5'-cyclic AMP phosphodiesterase CpdA